MKIKHYDKFVNEFRKDLSGTNVELKQGEAKEILLDHIFDPARDITNTPSEAGKGFQRLRKIYPHNADTLNMGEEDRSIQTFGMRRRQAANLTKKRRNRLRTRKRPSTVSKSPLIFS